MEIFWLKETPHSGLLLQSNSIKLYMKRKLGMHRWNIIMAQFIIIIIVCITFYIWCGEANVNHLAKCLSASYPPPRPVYRYSLTDKVFIWYRWTLLRKQLIKISFSYWLKCRCISSFQNRERFSFCMELPL